MPDLSSLEQWPAMLRDEPLAKHSQYGIGGPADCFAKVDNLDALVQLVSLARTAQIPVTVIGAGSNSLILDSGIRGLVIEIADKTMVVQDETVVTLNAGCMMPRCALDLAKLGLAGLEFGIGIPGTCGASIRGNAGAFGAEICDQMIDCVVLTGDGQRRTLTTAECEFAYRTSVFKHSLKDAIILSGRFRVQSDDPAAVRERTDAIQAGRKASQPYGIRSLGSVFTNPPGDHAGRLVEAAGLKGKRIGGAEISPKHANFIVNVDKASAADVLDLVGLAHDTVMARFGVDLQREIVVMGEASAAAVSLPLPSSEGKP